MPDDPEESREFSLVELGVALPAPPAFTGRLEGLRFDPATTPTRFVGATLVEVDFSGLDVSGFFADGSTFDHCDFSGVKLSDGTMSGLPTSIYRDCRFDRAKMRFQSPGLARFERCSFDRAVIDHWDCGHAAFVDCTFAGRFRDVTFSGGVVPSLASVVRPHPNEFRDNDFSAARLVATDFIGGIDLDAQRLPSGPGYRRFDIDPETIARVEALIPSLTDGERDAATRLVAWIRGRYAGQREAFTESL
jgi:hypothetical protein